MTEPLKYFWLRVLLYEELRFLRSQRQYAFSFSLDYYHLSQVDYERLTVCLLPHHEWLQADTRGLVVVKLCSACSPACGYVLWVLPLWLLRRLSLPDGGIF